MHNSLWSPSVLQSYKQWKHQMQALTYDPMIGSSGLPQFYWLEYTFGHVKHFKLFCFWNVVEQIYSYCPAETTLGKIEWNHS